MDTRCRVRRILESYFGRQNMANSTKRLHRGWNLWCRYISKMKLSEMSADQKATELKRQKALMKMMFSHMVYREISASFRTGGHAAKEQKRTEGILRKIKIRWTERILLKAYNGWVSYLHSNQYNRHTLNVAKSRLANTLLFKSWNSWKSYVNGIKSKRSLIVGIMMKIPIKLRSMGFHRNERNKYYIKNVLSSGVFKNFQTEMLVLR